MIHSYAYLLLLLPPDPVRDRIAMASEAVGPMRAPVRHGQLHMTLAQIADLPRRCPQMVGILDAILTGHQLHGCDFALARLVIKADIALLETLGRRRDLTALRTGLTARLSEVGLPRGWSRTFTPHVTLGRGRFQPANRRIAPIFWSPDRIALVESWRGATHHELLASWPLLPPIQPRFAFD